MSNSTVYAKVTGDVEVTDVAGVTDIVRVTDVTDVGITDVTGVTDIRVGTVQHMASNCGPPQGRVRRLAPRASLESW